MAKSNIYKSRINNVKKASSKISMSQQNNNNNMAKSIENSKIRLSNVGVDPVKAKDDRNWFEKALNLKQDQNALFDLFEIIGRPQQALFRGIESAQEGGSFFEGMKEGITGDETTNFGDILRNAGVSDKPLFRGPLSGEDRSLADILGFAGDIFLDPMDIPLAGVKVADTAADVIKTTDKALDAASDVAKTTKYTFAPFQKGSKSVLELAAGGVVKGAKKGLGIADNVISKGLSKTDTKTIKNIAENVGIIEKGTKVSDNMLPELTKQLSNMGIDVTSKLDAYKGLKKSFSRTADYSKSIPDNLYNSVKRTDNTIDMAAAYGNNLVANNKKLIDNYAAATGKVASQVDDDLQLLIASKYAPSTKFSDFLRDAVKNGSSSFNGNADEIKDILSKIDDFKLTNNISDDMLKVVKTKDGIKVVSGSGKNGSKNLKTLVNNKNLMSKLDNINLTKKTVDTLDKSLLERLSKIKDVYKNDTAFNEMMKQVEKSYNDYDDYIKSVTNGKVSFKDILREGYTRPKLTDEGSRTLNLLKENKMDFTKGNDEVLKGNKATFGAKKQSNVAEQANIDINKAMSTTIERKNKSIENLKNNLTESKIASKRKEIEEIASKRATLTKDAEEANKRFSKNIADKQIQSTIKNTKIQDIKDIVSDDIVKKSKNINNVNLVEGLNGKAIKYNEKVEKYQNLIKEYDNFRLNVTDVEKANKQLQKYDKKIAQAKRSMKKAEFELRTATGKVMAGAEEKFISRAGQLADSSLDKMESAVRSSQKANESLKNTLQKFEDTKKSFEDYGVRLERQQRKATLDLENLLSKTPEEAKRLDQHIYDDIASLQKDIDLLKSAEGTKFFSTSFNEGFSEFVTRTSSQAKAMNAYNEVLLHSGLRNKDVMEFVKKGEQPLNKVGKVKLDQRELKKITDNLDSFKNLLPEDSKLIHDFESLVKNSNEVWLDQGAKEMLTLASKANSNEANLLLKTINDTNNLFKKTSTMSPGFHLRNITGNASNMWLSGMSSKDIAKSYKDAARMSKSDYILDLIRKNADNTLNASEKSDFNIIKQFIESGAFGSGKDIRDLGDLIAKASKDDVSKNAFKKAWDKVFEVNAKANEKMDNISRLALLSHASNNPKYVAKLGANDAIDAMRQVLFDPQNLSPFEKKYLKNIIPFYTFAKQNLMFQMKNVVNNTSRYNKLIKAYNKMYDSVGEGNYRQYQKENFELPIATPDSPLGQLLGVKNAIGLKTNLPVGDLGEYVSNPLQRLVSSTSPLIKTPFEQVTGKDTFTGRDISDRNTLQALLDTTGLSNFTTKQLDKGKNIISGINSGDYNVGQALLDLNPSIFRQTDPQKVQNQAQYEELMKYQEIIKQLKSQGIDVPTIRELTNSTNNSLRNIKRTRSRYQKRRS